MGGQHTNEYERLLEYFGRFDSGMFQDQRARVKIGTSGEERGMISGCGMNNRADELDWIKGQAG